MVGIQPEPLVKNSKDVSHLSSGCSAVGMKLVDDEVKHVGRIFKPAPRSGEYLVFDIAHQHDVQHAVVRDQDVGRSILHIPPAPHLAAVEAGKEALRVRASDPRGQRALSAQLRSQFRFCVVALRTSGDRRPAGVSSKPEPVPSAVGAEPRAYPVAVERLAEPRHLIFGQRVQGIEDERADC